LDKMDSGKWFKKWNGKNYNARRKWMYKKNKNLINKSFLQKNMKNPAIKID
jgi:hypothetical protein